MNKTAIKNYAIWARVQLIESAKQRAFEYAITDGENDPNLEIINGRILSSEEKNQRTELISLIKQKGFEQVMEEAAYTWFNRFIALRFMEVNGYLPSKVRVFTDENNEFKPQILKEAMTLELDGLDRDRILSSIEKQDNEELFKYLIIAQCNALSSGLPGMFETISNWTELLFPANLLKADSVIGQMITNIPEEDWTDQVQIIGWLYQYYNSELKDDTFAKLKKNIKISKERIPAATQLFTPDWIVRYMVENSLGRLWYEGHPGFDKSEWKYYLDEAEQEPEVEEELKKIRAEYAQIKPEEIKIIDPCMGSGHILVYAFDVLMQIYTSAGWSERDAAKSILENNLFGLDIDDRAGQLAYFAVMMKARKHNRRILNGEVRPKVLAIQESNGIDIDLDRLGPEKNIAQKLIKELKDAKEYGSILNLSIKQIELDSLKRRLEDIDEISSTGSFLVQYETAQIINCLYPLIELAEVMIQKYDVVITNPPYMGINNMGGSFYSHITERYEAFKHDLYCVFIEACHLYLKSRRFQAMITQQSFMFNSRYEKAREQIINKNSCVSFVHLGARAFEEIGGEVVQTAAFVFMSSKIRKMKGRFMNLQDYPSQDLKETAFLSNNNINNSNITYYKSLNDFETIQGLSFSYWLSKQFLSTLKSKKKLGSIAETRHGLVTGNGELFMRLWYEVSSLKFDSSLENGDLKVTKNVWFPYNKGGSIRRWYGNREYVVNWYRNGFSIRNYMVDGKLKSSNYNLDFNCKPNISWTDISTGFFSARYTPKGSLFDTSGPSLFVNECSNTASLLGFLNTKVMQKYLEIYCVGLHYSTGAVASVPILYEKSETVDKIVYENIRMAKDDYDSFETSWDFKQHPLI